MITSPKVGLNAHLLSGSASYRSAGIHQYIDRLLSHLPAVYDDSELVIFTNRQAGADLLKTSCWQGEPRPSVRASWLPTQRPLARIVWEQLAQPLWAGLGGLQLLHGLAFVLPLVRPCPSVVTVYDLSFAHFPHLFRGPNAAYLRLFTRLSCRVADKVIAISQSTRNDVARLYGVPGERVEVALPGVDPSFCPLPPEQVELFRQKRGLPQTFILHVGTLEPRKNHIRLLEAFQQISNFKLQIANCKLQIANFKLVLVGGQGWSYGEIYAAVERLGLQDQVIFAGYAPADELPLWYNAATLFVYPSLYEGFGMPALEAMACGVPVIASDSSSLPEVVGGAGLLVPPNDVDALAGAMRQLLADADLRQQLSRAGRARAAEFTWQHTARVTAETYRKILRMDGTANGK